MGDGPEEVDEEVRSGRRLLIMLISGMVMIVIGITIVFMLVH